MKRNFIKIYTIFAVLAYLFSAGYFCLSIYNVYTYQYNPSSILECGKISFLIVLIVTIITLILLISSTKAENKNEAVSESKLIESDQTEKNIPEVEKEVSAITENNGPSENDNSSETEAENEAEKTDGTSELDDETEAELAAASDSPVETEHNDEQKIDINVFVPEPIRTFLKNKIDYANENNTETGIFVMNFLSSAFQQEDLDKILKVIKAYFTDENSITSYKETFLLGIKPDLNLDENLANADKIVSEIESLFTDKQVKCYFGLSNRNTRNIDAGRLLFEAEAAMNHAMETEEKVIAFKVNIDQYNKFIAENS